MIGALAGDIVGSIYEWDNIKTTEFDLFQDHCFFTDDSVLTVALADSIMTGVSYGKKLQEYFRKYPDADYGSHFRAWASQPMLLPPYNSCGNGAGMRISPVGWAYKTLNETLDKAEEFTAVTHNHPEGIKAGKATASAIFLGRNGYSKAEISKFIEDCFEYDLSQSCSEIRPFYKFDSTAQGTTPQAIIAFLESTSFESAIRLAVSLGGDSDTLTCITGSISEAFYGGVSELIRSKTLSYLDEHLTRVTSRFVEQFVNK